MRASRFEHDRVVTVRGAPFRAPERARGRDVSYEHLVCSRRGRSGRAIPDATHASDAMLPLSRPPASRQGRRVRRKSSAPDGFGRSGVTYRKQVVSSRAQTFAPSLTLENKSSLSRRRSRGVASRAPRRSRPTARGGSWSRPRRRAARLVSSRDPLAFVRTEPRPAARARPRAGIPRRARFLATRCLPPGPHPRGA